MHKSVGTEKRGARKPLRVTGIALFNGESVP
jgi:hypothetical protein